MPPPSKRNIKETKTTAPGVVEAPCKNKKKQKVKLAYVNITSIDFTSGHPMKDNTADYKDTGTNYTKPEWTSAASNPVCLSSEAAFTISMQLDIGNPGAAPETGSLVCKSNDREIIRVDNMVFSPGSQTVNLTSILIGRRIEVDSFPLVWTLEGISVPIAPATTTHELLFVWDTPTGTTDSSGVTYQRISKSIALIDRVNPHPIVKSLMGRFKNYVLRWDPAVPKAKDHPRYFDNPEKAWAIMDYIKQSGECQAIVRFVTNVIKQIGLPGTAETVYVYATHNDPGRAKESTDSTKCLNPAGGYALVDGPVKTGTSYPPSHTMDKDGKPSPGFNRYEACLKYDVNGVAKYYPGGAEGVVLDTAAEVLKLFYALVEVKKGWYPDDKAKKKVPSYEIIRIVKKYQ